MGVAYMSQIDLVELGIRVKEARRERGLTQGQVAVMIGSSRSRVIAFENGYAPDISINTVIHMLNAVGLDFRLSTFNDGCPTLDDLQAEQAEEDARNARRGLPQPRW
ncbi:XRE family transcriptional regulator [Methylobacterium nonmethylotrophicum]|uniref:XRE family transcriptional regulator n=2 Tax=Methylobacterium nonmethylotrophicum TaxID=1141884 RepID=A0A4Z0NS59_9HYPH|nr:XRE family transcriptional regulator [Methylobacterium nonmethylotrophicum]